MPARSTLSRFLAALPPEPVEALRALFLSDLLARPLVPEGQAAGLWDRTESRWQVFDIDGTREAARQRAFPQAAELPVPERRLRLLCAPGYTGRKRGEVVRSRTTILQAHTHQWLGSFGGSGNGKSREELRRAVAQIHHSLTAYQLPAECVLLRLDGLYGTGAPLSDLAGLPFVMRGKDSQLLLRAEVQFRLSLPPDQQFSRPESAFVRTLYDCSEVTVGPDGQRCRVVVATHPAGPGKPRVGVERDGIVYELFLTKLPQGAFTAADVVALYLHRGAFENALSDEDCEQEPDRWCSHAAWGQECWQIVAQWVAEPPTRTGSPPAPGSRAHDGVCPCPSGWTGFGWRLSFSCAGLWIRRRCHGLEGWSLLRSRLPLPARWHLALSCWAKAFGTRTAPRSRWKLACGVCRQHSQLSPLPSA